MALSEKIGNVNFAFAGLFMISSRDWMVFPSKYPGSGDGDEHRARDV